MMMDILSDRAPSEEIVLFHYSLSILFLFLHILIIFSIKKDSREINAGNMFSYPSIFHVITWKTPTWTIVVTLTGFIGVAYYFFYRRNIFMANNPIGRLTPKREDIPPGLPYRYQYTKYDRFVVINCITCKATFEIPDKEIEPKCPNCRSRFNRCGYCRTLFNIRGVRCPSCKRYNSFRTVEVVFGTVFLTFSVLCLILAMIFQNTLIGVGFVIAFIFGFLLIIAFPIRPFWWYLDEYYPPKGYYRKRIR